MTKLHYVVAPIFYGLVGLFCWFFMAQGQGGWYSLIVKPAYMPAGWVVVGGQLISFVSACFSLILFVNHAKGTQVFGTVLRLYLLNGLFNVAFCYLFFVQHVIGPAVLVQAFVAGSVVMVMALARPYSYRVVLLLLPCFVLAAFFTRLGYDIFMLN